MIKFIDNFLNNITMYRLMLYFLIFLISVATVFSFFKILPFNPLSLVLSAVVLVVACFLTNTILAKIFKVSANLESAYITALILALIITPAANFYNSFFLVLYAAIAMASKYLVPIGKKHVFNPAAFAVSLPMFISGLFENSFPGASWWVGSMPLTLFVLIGGILVVRKIGRFSLVVSFLIASLIVTLGFSLLRKADLMLVFKDTVLNSPLLFFAFVMLTEPQTTPPTNKLRILYGGIVGFLSTNLLYEIALLFGNVFSYTTNTQQILVLKLKEKVQVGKNIYGFIFSPGKKFNFLPGQYLEWVLDFPNPDDRGNKRYFTIASSPTEDDIQIGIKISDKSSSFKKALLSLPKDGKIIAGQLAGDFILPNDLNQKLVFIAGGIGVTPFRSMVKYLLDKNQKRPITLFYMVKESSEIVYRDIFDDAQQKLGIKVIYVITDVSKVPAKWMGKIGYINTAMIKKEVPDFKDRLFYLSGPRAMVSSLEEVLYAMGIKQVKTDYFPGY